MNHWFNTAINIIGYIKQINPDAYFIGTNEDEYSVIKTCCDEWYKEPVLNDDEYIEYCLEFCKKHGVDVFMPRRGLISISKNKVLFNNIGVSVLVDDYDIVSILNDKRLSYELFKVKGIEIIPDYYIVETLVEFINAYETLSKKYSQICFKFVKDEGGKSFRLVDNNRKGYKALFKKQNTRMTLKDVTEALSEQARFAPIMVMPFLSGDEVSVDCLNTEKGLISIPRIKGLNKHEIVRFDDEILLLCERFQQITNLQMPYNIQFKYLNDKLYFLEINTRMSGGIHMSCYASKVNIPGIAIEKLMGMESNWTLPDPNTEIKVSQLLTPVFV